MLKKTPIPFLSGLEQEVGPAGEGVAWPDKAEQDQLRFHLGWVTHSHRLEMEEQGGM